MNLEQTIRRIDQCLMAISGPSLTPDEAAEYRALVAAEDSRAERRRNPSPQFELEGGDGC